MPDRRALVLVCLFAFFGFGNENVMAAMLPLVVIDRGGDAAVVGVLVAAYGIPTIVLRPFLGRLLDGPRRPLIVRGGSAVVALAPLAFLVPSLATMVVARVVQGAGWAAYGTSGQAMLARVAPAGRRGEAAGYYNAMPALTILLGPALGLWLYATWSASATFVLAAGLGLAGLLVTRGLPVRVAVPDRRTPGPPVRLVARVFDPVAIVPMLLVATYMSVQSLFVVFVPLYARDQDIPLELLAVYYPVYGVVVLIAHLSLGRVSDRIGRRPVAAAGCATAIVGLLVAGLAGGLPGLLVAGSLYGIATGLVLSTVSAVTMETAPPERLGSAMATYSVGYQLGASVGGAAWGAIISLAGYPWPFLAGALLVGISLLLAAFRLPRPAVLAERARTRSDP